MFEVSKLSVSGMNETETNTLMSSLKEISTKNNQLVHNVMSNVNISNKTNSNNGTTIIRKPYASKTPIHRQKPRHVPSFCTFNDNKISNFEKDLLEKVSSDSERNIIFSHYEPGTIGLRRYAVTHQDEVDGYIFDFSKRSTRLSNDTMDRTVITVGFTGRKKRWTLCPSCDCIPKADKREKIVGQWKILYLSPKGGNLMVPRCVYEAYGDVVDDCNYFAATLCPQQTYCAKHSNQTSFLNRNWHYSYRHQFALQDYIVFCDHLQSVKLVWKLQNTKDNEIVNDINAELAEKTLISVMQRFLEYTRINGTSNFLVSISNQGINTKNENLEESTFLNNSSICEKDERNSSESLQSCSSSESLSAQLDLNKLQLQFAAHLNSQVSQMMVQQNPNIPYNSVMNSLTQQQSLYLQDFFNYLDGTKKMDTNSIDRLKNFNISQSSQNTPSVRMSDNLSNSSSMGNTPLSIDCTDASIAHARMINATLNTEESSNNSAKTNIVNIESESQTSTANCSNVNLNCQNLQIDLMEALRNNSVMIGTSLQSLCHMNQTLNLPNFSPVQIPQLIHTSGNSNPTYLFLGANSSIYPLYIPVNQFGTFDTQNILNSTSILNKQKNEPNLSLFSFNSQYPSDITTVPIGLIANTNQSTNSGIFNNFKQTSMQNSGFLADGTKFNPQLSQIAHAHSLFNDKNKKGPNFDAEIGPSNITFKIDEATNAT